MAFVAHMDDGEGGEEQRGGLEQSSFTLTSMELGCAAG